MAGEVRPAVDLDQQVGQVDDRQLVCYLARELVAVGLARLGAQPLDAEVAALADRDVGVTGLQVAIKRLAMTQGSQYSRARTVHETNGVGLRPEPRFPGQVYVILLIERRRSGRVVVATGGAINRAPRDPVFRQRAGIVKVA